MKRKLVVLMLVVGMVFSSVAMVSAAVTTLEFWGHLWGAEVPVIEELISRFEAANPTVEINFTQVADPDQRLAIQVGDFPDLMKTNTIYPNVAMGAIIPLDEYLEGWEGLEDIPQFVWEQLTAEGKKYALPCGLWAHLLFVNKAHMADAGLTQADLPTTWDQLYEIGQALTRDVDGDGITDRYGLVLRGGYNWEFRGVMVQDNLKLIDPVTLETDITTPKFAEALTKYTDLVTKYKVTPPGVVGYQWGDALNAFTTQQVSMLVDGLWDVPNFALTNPELDYYIVQFPPYDEGPTIAEVHSYMVSSKSKNPELAARFLKFLLSTESRKYWCSTLYNMPFLKSLAKEPIFVGDEKFAAGTKVILNSKDLPVRHLVYFEDAARAIDKAIQEVMLGRATPEDALAAALPKIEEVIESEEALRD